MATEGEATFSSAATATSSPTARGVGGKLKRQPARRHAATPYSRRPHNQVQRRPWISKIVDPAYRIISGGATRILPYFFSNAASAPALTAPDDQDQHQDKLQSDPHENDPSMTPSLYKPRSASFEEGGPSGTANVNEGNFNINAQTRGKTALNDAVAISELERLMEGKTFSQAETNRLIEIITSRAIVSPDVKRDERNLEIPLREGAKKNMSLFDKRKEPIGGKDTNSELWTAPTPLAKSIIFDGDKQIRDEAGLSPAELAKAYMGGQTSSSSSQGFVARNEKDCLDRGMLVGKPSLASPSSKSTCWPGIKTIEQSGFATPQSQRESVGLQNFPRTPYSRTILSNSKSKLMQLQNDSSKRLSNLQSPYQSVQTRYGQLSNGRDGGLFGPSRRSRQSTTPSMVSPYSRPSRGISRFENSAITKSSEAMESSYLSRSQKTAYGKHKESEVGTPTVPTHSSQIARTILDHLERTQSTPKNKSAELKLATSWRYAQSSKTVEQSSSNVDNVKKDGSAKLNKDIQNIFSHNLSSSVLEPPATTTGDTQNGKTKTKTASASNGIFLETQAASRSGNALQFGLEKPKGSLSRSTHEELVTSSQDAAKAVPYSFGGEPANVPKPPSHSLGNNKPVLPSISVAKPFQKWAVPSGTNAGFTFPVSSSDGATSSEPTTPSVMPFTASPAPSGGVAITSHHEVRRDDEIPQFSFNGNRGGDKSPLVFSFPSVNEEVVNEDDDARLGIKFTFGSQKPERISFSSAGNDGVCC